MKTLLRFFLDESCVSHDGENNYGELCLNKIEDKSKDVLHSDYLYVREIEEQDYYIILY